MVIQILNRLSGTDMCVGDNIVAFVKNVHVLSWLSKNVSMVSLKRAVCIFNAVLSLQPVAP